MTISQKISIRTASFAICCYSLKRSGGKSGVTQQGMQRATVWTESSLVACSLIIGMVSWWGGQDHGGFRSVLPREDYFVVTISSVIAVICNFGQWTLPARKHSPSLWLSYWSHNSTYTTGQVLLLGYGITVNMYGVGSISDCFGQLHFWSLTYLKSCLTWNVCHCRNECICTVNKRDPGVTYCCGLGMILSSSVLPLRLSIFTCSPSPSASC